VRKIITLALAFLASPLAAKKAADGEGSEKD